MIPTAQLRYPYPYMPLQARRDVLPQHNVCSISPGAEPSDWLYTGNGSHRIDVSGDPWHDEICVTQELLYEPKWRETPLPPDLRPYIGEIRRLVMAGQSDEADKILDKALREAGFDQRMNMDARIVYPTESLRLHKAFWLTADTEKDTSIHDYLRWTDLHTGRISTVWTDARGTFTHEALADWEHDVTAFRFTAPQGQLNMTLTLRLPIGMKIFGREILKGAEFRVTRTPDLFTVSCAYDPEFGAKGYVVLLRFLPSGGSVEVEGDGIRVTGADTLVVVAKAIRIEEDFAFGCETALAEDFMHLPVDFDEFEAHNRRILGEKMARSELYLTGPDQDDYLLSGEELLTRSRSRSLLDPALMEKLYDMGRFYQIIDTGRIPPMWGQHNINTNLQVCAGNNTGLFEEMDVYFKYYESKFDDFRTNAERLFGARGLLASVHCDYDSGLLYHFSRTYPHYCWTGCLGWIYNEFWNYYLCTGDEDFLRERIVPALAEIALFFEDYACDRDERGKVIFYPSFSPEDPTPNPDYGTVTGRNINPTRINSVMDIAICREVLTNLITACRILKIREEEIPHWQQQLDDLPVYWLDEDGGLKEWAWPTVEENYNHRHVSHHYDVWPGRAVTPEREPALAEAICISNRKRGQQDDSAHGIIHRAFTAIRLKDREESEQNLGQLIGHGFVRRNLSTAHFPYRGQFPDLQGAMPALLLEMCVYSEPGIVEFLPALPDTFSAGKLQGIWLYTWAKLHCLTWVANGLTAQITSDRDQVLTLRIRRPVQRFLLDGTEMPMDGDHVEVSFKRGETKEIQVSF